MWETWIMVVKPYRFRARQPKPQINNVGNPNAGFETRKVRAIRIFAHLKDSTRGSRNLIETALGATTQRILNPRKPVLAVLATLLRILVLVLKPPVRVDDGLRRRHVHVRPQQEVELRTCAR